MKFCRWGNAPSLGRRIVISPNFHFGLHASSPRTNMCEYITSGTKSNTHKQCVSSTYMVKLSPMPMHDSHNARSTWTHNHWAPRPSTLVGESHPWEMKTWCGRNQTGTRLGSRRISWLRKTRPIPNQTRERSCQIYRFLQPCGPSCSHTGSA